MYRQVYQGSQGGATYVPLEINSRLIGKSTPKLAKMLTWKYAHLSGKQTQTDLSENHNLKFSIKLIQSVNGRVGDILTAKEQKWKYVDPVIEEDVVSIGISRDGTTTLIKNEGYKETMVGTIALYNKEGNRQHTVYLGSSPQHGKAVFDYEFSQQIERIQHKYPKAEMVGIADGEKGNWTFLEKYTSVQILDFWHATEYLAAYAKIAYKTEDERKEWLEKSCKNLKHKRGAVTRLLKEMSNYAIEHNIKDKDNPVSRAVTYFTNQKVRMKYWKYTEKGLPIGSGVVEAACKTLVKQRFSRSGSRWTRITVDHILLSKSMILTNGRWKQFWAKLKRYGL